MDISDETLDELIRALHRKQYRKSVGLLSTNEVQTFMNSIQELLRRLLEFGDGNFLTGAELAATTTECEYENYNWNTPVAYKGPFTLLKYENGDFKVIRIEPESDYYMTSLGPTPGVTVNLSVPCGFMPAQRIFALFPRNVDTERSYISAHEEMLNIVIHCEIGNFSYAK